MGMRATIGSTLAAVLLVLAPSAARAVPLAFATTSGAPATSEATSIIVVRHGPRYVVTIGTTYRGPAEPFVVLLELPRETRTRMAPRIVDPRIIDRLERSTAPFVQHLYEDDPCRTEPLAAPDGLGGGGTGSGIGYGAAIATGLERGASAAAAGYRMTFLDGAELREWLEAHAYASDVAADFVRLGSPPRVLAIQVDPARLSFEGGAARLAPFQFEHDSERLWLQSSVPSYGSDSSTDEHVYVIADVRYEVERDTTAAPRAIDLTAAAGERFDDVYAAIFDRALDRADVTTLTELACPVSRCLDRGALLTPEELTMLGAARVTPSPPGDVVPSLRVGMGAVEVLGDLPQATVTGVIRRHVPEILSCYAAAIALRSDLDGDVAVVTSVAPSGAASVPTITTTMASPPGLVDCVATSVSEWIFPASTGSTVSVAFALENVGGSAGLATRAFLSSAIATRLHLRSGDGPVALEEAAPLDDVQTGGEGLTAGIDGWDARYAIRHPWIGAVACDSPRGGHWIDTPPDGSRASTTVSALRRWTPPPADLDLAAMIAADPYARLSDAPAAVVPEALEGPVEVPPAPPVASAPPEASGGCSVGLADRSGLPSLVLVLVLGARARRRR
jgi:hypothetical protein